MAVSQLRANGTTQTASSPYNLLLATFCAAILTSAALLFAVQPMFTKMVLPRLGGAAAVWSVAMVFFQATLLQCINPKGWVFAIGALAAYTTVGGNVLRETAIITVVNAAACS